MKGGELTGLAGDGESHANDAIGVGVVVGGCGELESGVGEYDAAVADGVIADIALDGSGGEAYGERVTGIVDPGGTCGWVEGGVVGVYIRGGQVVPSAQPEIA